MKLGDSKAVKTAQWFANEILRNDDINFVGESTYQNITDQLALLFVDDLGTGEQDFVVGKGLRLLWDNLLTTNLQTGAAISTKGAYLNADAWGFIADPGGIFSVVVPINQAVAFSAGGTFARIDIIEVRPVEFEYHSVSRNFKDPITGLVSSAIVKTRKEYEYEFAVREGDDTTVLTKEVTTFTVNASTVGSDIAGKYVLFSTIYDDYYVWYNTGASSDPEVSGRTGIVVSIGAADDKDEIALATRTAITVAGVVVSGATNQIILTGSTFANLTDGTNGDMGSFFDAIAITQGNGALLHTEGWIKIAEIDVGASAAAITQNDIRNVDESDQWENEPNGTLFTRRAAVGVSIEDSEEYLTAIETEAAIEELAALVKQNITVAENVSAFDPIGIANSKFYKAKFNLLTSATVVDTGGFGHVYNDIASLGSNFFVVAFKDSGGTGHARVGEYSNGSITWKTAISEFETGDCYYISVDNLGSNHFVIAYRDQGDAGKGKAIIGEFTGSAITWKTAVTVFEDGSTGHVAVVSLGSNVFVIGFMDDDDSDKGKHRVGEFTTGDTITWRVGPIVFSGINPANHISMINLGSNYFLTVFHETGGNDGEVYIKQFVPPSTLDAKAGGEFKDTINMERSSVALIDSGRFVIAYANSSLKFFVQIGEYNIENNKLIWPIDEIEIGWIDDAGYGIDVASLGSNTFAITYINDLGAKGEVKVGRYNCGAIDWLGRQVFEDTNLVVVQSCHVAALGSNTYVVIWTHLGVGLESRVLAVPLYIGTITETVTLGNSGLLQMKGLLSGLSGLEMGVEYFVDYYTGAKSKSGIDKIGKAFSDTKLLLD